MLNPCLPSVCWYKSMAEAELVCLYHPCTVLDPYRSILRSYFNSILGCVSFYACLLGLIKHSRRAAVSCVCIYTHTFELLFIRRALKVMFSNNYSATKGMPFQRNPDTAGLLCAAIYCTGVNTLHG